MSATKRAGTSAQGQFVDSLESDVAESFEDPQYRAAYEDGAERFDLIDRLVSMRKERKLTQKQVAERMGVGQSTIAGFENEGSDPRLSTIQRYARAVEARCVVTIQVPLACDWVVQPCARYSASGSTARSTRVDTPTPETEAIARAANEMRSSFAMAA